MNFQTKLRNWIKKEDISYTILCINLKAIHILEKNLDKVDWLQLSRNPNDRAVNLLLENQDRIDWHGLVLNPNIRALKFLEKNPGKIDWYWLSRNPCLFELDYFSMARERTDIFREDLMKAVWHPNRLKKMGYFEINEWGNY